MICSGEDQHKIRTGRVEALLPGGEASVRHADGIFLVPNVLPGEKIRFIDRGKRRGARRGEVEQVLHASSHRVPAPCRYAGACGGCSMQFLQAGEHGRIKSGWVRDAFSTLITPDTDWQPILTSPTVAGRRRVRWQQGTDEGGSFLGFRARASRKMVRHDQCLLLLPKLNALRRDLEEFMPSTIESVSMTMLDEGVHVILEASLHPQLPPQVMNMPKVQWWWKYNNKIMPLSSSVKVLHDVILEGKRQIELAIGPEGFIQTQRSMNNEMVTQVMDWSLPVRRVVDLFSGAGNFSLPLAAEGSLITGADIDLEGVRAANLNAKRLGLQADYLQMDLLKEFDPAPFAGADLLILDPPRKGARRICRAVNIMMPRKVIMISCNVAAGARDGKILAGYGYHLKALRALDLFPYSGHVEAMSLWSRD